MCLVGGFCPLHAYLVHSHAVRAVRRGGNLNNGANYGPCYFNANNAPSNSNWNYGAGIPYTVEMRMLVLHIILPWFLWNRNAIRLDRLGRFTLEEPKG